MLQMDFKAHNRRSEAIWKAYHADRPTRVPVTLYADARNWLHETAENRKHITLSEYLKDPALMLDCQVRARDWIRHTYLSDDGMGDPEEGWSVTVDCQNYLEPVWFGAQLKDGIEPHAPAFLADADKWRIFEAGHPDAFSGIGEQVRTYYEWFQDRKRDFSYKGIPLTGVHMPFNMTGTDGPFTVACGIRGVENFLCDLVEDPDYACQMLDFVTSAILKRILTVRAYLGESARSGGFGFGDDAIVLLSPAMYREFVLPMHRRLYEELTVPGGARGIHLCGDAQRFFPMLANDLGVRDFDTGFPIDFAKLYRELPPDTRVNGGPEASLLRGGSPEQVTARVQEILSAGVMERSGKFVLREANALSPGTPPENVNAMYRACERFGWYERNK